MPILGVESKRKNYRLVGVTVPPLVNNYITLFTVARGLAKSNLFNNLITDWIEESKEAGQNEDYLMEQLIQRIWDQWSAKKKKNPRASFNEFKQKLLTELEKKGLNKKQIGTINKAIK